MSRALVPLGIVAALLILAGGSASPVVPASPSKPSGGEGGGAPRPPKGAAGNPPILVIGDSLGVGLTNPLERHLGSAVRGAAKEGASVDAWADKSLLNAALASSAPALVVIVLGANDIAGGPALDAAKRDKVRRIVNRVREAGGVPVWIGPPTLPTLNPTRDAQFRALLTAELNDAHVPLFLSELIPFERAPDQIHATWRGYDQWAEFIVSWLSDLGLVAPPRGLL